MKKEETFRNTYLPYIFGIVGYLYHLAQDKKDEKNKEVEFLLDEMVSELRLDKIDAAAKQKYFKDIEIRLNIINFDQPTIPSDAELESRLAALKEGNEGNEGGRRKTLRRRRKSKRRRKTFR